MKGSFLQPWKPVLMCICVIPMGSENSIRIICLCNIIIALMSMKVKFWLIIYNVFLTFPPNIDPEYLLKQPRSDGSTEYQQYRFMRHNKRT